MAVVVSAAVVATTSTTFVVITGRSAATPLDTRSKYQPREEVAAVTAVLEVVVVRQDVAGRHYIRVC
jgi:hypothetical protein